jgi:hypothetical protein
MNRGGGIIPAMRELIAIFALRCSDRTTLEQLAAITPVRGDWPKAREIFQHIRAKSLRALRMNDPLLEAQYRFEEVCAKTLYNLTGSNAPFDADSPYWIVPYAISLARQLGIDDAEVLRVVVI